MDQAAELAQAESLVVAPAGTVADTAVGIAADTVVVVVVGTAAVAVNPRKMEMEMGMLTLKQTLEQTCVEKR